MVIICVSLLYFCLLYTRMTHALCVTYRSHHEDTCQGAQCFNSVQMFFVGCWFLTLFRSPVLHLLLYTGPGVVLSVPEDQL